MHQWDCSGHEFLMFELRTMLKQLGQIYIPIDKAKMISSFFSQIEFQISAGIETRIYYTNFTSVHVFKIDQLIKRSDIAESVILSRVHRYFANQKDAEYWLCVSDVYVLNTPHLDPNEFIDKEFSYFISLADNSSSALEISRKSFELFTPIFVKEKNPSNIFHPFSGYKIDCNDVVRFQKWIETDRSLNENNLLRMYLLSSIIFHEGWGTFCAATQYYLNKHQEYQQSASSKQLNEKIRLNLDSFECYLIALFHELDNYAITPLDDVFKLHPELVGILSGQSFSHLKFFKAHLLQPRNADAILSFLKNATSDFFSSSCILEKQLPGDIFIRIDKDLKLILARLQKLQHSKILCFVEELLQYYKLAQSQIYPAAQSRQDQLELYKYLLKLNSRICSSFIDENVILQLSEIRIGRVLADKPVRKLIEEWTISNRKKFKKAA
jgi:hypothetical protein